MEGADLETRVSNALKDWKSSVDTYVSTEDSGGDSERRLRPWDLQGLKTRHQTFSARTWFGKAKEVDSVECAAHGWENVESEVLECVLCHERLQYADHRLNAKEYTKHFAQLLRSAHRDLCPWKGTYTNEQICESLVHRFRNNSTTTTTSSCAPEDTPEEFDSARLDELGRRVRKVLDEF